MERVLQVVAGMGRGGVETTLMNIFRTLDRSKIVFDFLLQTDKKCDYHDEILSLGGRIYSVTPRNKSVLKNRKELNEFFGEHNDYKIVHMHVSSLSYVEPLKAAHRHGVPVRIIHSRNTKQGGKSRIHKYLHYWNQRNVKSFATDFFACSDLAAFWLYGKKQFEAGEFKIINNGIQVDKFVYNPQKREEMRSNLEISNKFAIVNVGRFYNQKNHMFLLDIFKNIHDKRSDSVLVLIGDGPLRQSVENKIEQLGLKESVILTGVRSDIPELLQAMDIFIMPSFYEGLPGTIVEAQGAGLPCLLSDTITKQVQITTLVDYISLDSDPEIWANRAMQMVDSNERRNTQQELKDAGFDMTTISKKLENFYISKYN